MSSGYACKLHTDKSGKTINETIVWPPRPTDWRRSRRSLVDLTGVADDSSPVAPDGVHRVSPLKLFRDARTTRTR